MEKKLTRKQKEVNSHIYFFSKTIQTNVLNYVHVFIYTCDSIRKEDEVVA